MEEKQVLLVTTTGDFLLKFQREEVKLLQRMGYLVHYAANFHEPPYVQDRAAIEALGVQTHQIPIARSPFLFRDNLRALEELLALLDRYPIGALHCHTPVGACWGGWRAGCTRSGRWWCSTPPTGSTSTGGRR